MVDFGYDISDFYDIQPEYGTLDDFRALIKRANELGIKIILDFVPNHSSDENVWFKKSVARERGYEDYYVWHDGRLNSSTGKREPPTNWNQYFRGTAWQWNEQRGQYYLHQFAVQQPDLNYRNPAVVEQMKRVLRYWLKEGVAGFRCDALPPLFEVQRDAQGQYPDEELTNAIEDVEDRAYLTTKYIENQPETVDMVYQWRQVLDDHQRIFGGDAGVLLIETYSPAWFTMQFYGNSSVNGAHLPFNFNFITVMEQGPLSASNVQLAIDLWLQNMPAGRTANWVLGNHDKRRAASRYGVEHIDAMNMLVMVLPGASVTYQGEELGMTDGWISWEDTVDPWGCNSDAQNYEHYTRDPERTPFHWSSGKNAGFSTGERTWLPLAADYETINVASEEAATHSHLKIYKSLVALRRSSTILQNGSVKYRAHTEEVFVVKRTLAGAGSIVYAANFGAAKVSVDLREFDKTLPSTLKLLIRSVGASKTEGQSYSVSHLELDAGEALLLATN
ncbi:maltase A1 [Drosophila busckii]|nr:maltase A1 [Drosophila busckii]